MTIAPDKLKHLRGGAVLALSIAALVLLGAWSLPAAIAVGGTVACGVVEWYQRYRGQGKAEWGDLVAGAAPSWVLAAAWCWLA
jgi:hypothetical protein